MNDLFEDIKRKKRYLKVVAVVLLLYNLIRFFSVFAAPYSLVGLARGDIDYSISTYQATFANYFHIEAEKLQSSTTAIIAMLVYSACLATGYMIGALLLGKGRQAAKKYILTLVAIEVAGDIFLMAYYKILPSKISLIVIIFLFLLFRSPSMSKELE